MTIHNGTEWVVRNRKRPKGTSTSATITKQPFIMFNPLVGCKDLYEHRRDLPIPGAIDDYNRFMGGVDIADQLRASFTTQQRGVKPWRALFYWLLDSTIVNAFQLSEHQRNTRFGRNKPLRSAHRIFRESLVVSLLQPPIPTPIPIPIPTPLAPGSYISKNTKLPKIRLTRPIEIHQKVEGKRIRCVFSRWSRIAKRRLEKVTIPISEFCRTKIVYNHCQVNLCNDCF